MQRSPRVVPEVQSVSRVVLSRPPSIRATAPQTHAVEAGSSVQAKTIRDDSFGCEAPHSSGAFLSDHGASTAGGAQRRPSHSPAFDKASRRSAALLLHHQRPNPPRGTPGSGRGERAPERSLVGGRGRAAGSRAPPDRKQQSLCRSNAAEAITTPLTRQRGPPQQRSSPRGANGHKAAGAAPPRDTHVSAPNSAIRLIARRDSKCALGSLGFPLPSPKVEANKN